MDLVTWMTANNKSTQDIADKIGKTRPYVSRIRRGEVNPSLSVAMKIVRFTKGEVEIEHLLPRAERPKVKQPRGRPRKTPDTAQKRPVTKASKLSASA